MDKTEYKLIQSTKRRLESQGNREYIVIDNKGLRRILSFFRNAEDVHNYIECKIIRSHKMTFDEALSHQYQQRGI
jgi:hypothetical protein